MKSKLVILGAVAGALSLLAGEPAREWPLDVGPVGRYQVIVGETGVLGSGSALSEKFAMRLDTMTGQTWLLFASARPGREALHWRAIDEQPAAPNLPPAAGSGSESIKPH